MPHRARAILAVAKLIHLTDAAISFAKYLKIYVRHVLQLQLITIEQMQSDAHFTALQFLQ